MRIGLLGFGTVGMGVYELTAPRNDMEVVRVLCRRELSLKDAEVTHDFNDILRSHHRYGGGGHRRSAPRL